MTNGQTSSLTAAFHRFTHSGALPHDSVLMPVDVQARFADPTMGRGTPATDHTARTIAAIAPDFRAAGVPVWPVFYGRSGHHAPHHFIPAAQDTPFFKSEDSALSVPSLAPALRAAQRKHIILCGFNLNACLFKTAMDAAEIGLTVTILHDLSGNDLQNTGNPHRALYTMDKSGVRISDSTTILQELRTPALRRAAIPYPG